VNCRIPIANYRLPTFCRHGSIGFSLLVLCVLGEITSVAAPATFTAALDRDTISVGESVTLSFTIEDGVPAEVPIVPPVPNLSIRSLGQSSKYNFINGRSSTTLTYNFLVRATQPGDYTIPAVSALVDGKTLASPPLKLKWFKK